MEKQTTFPAFGVEHFAAAAAAAGRALDLARGASAPSAGPLAARELLYAEAAAARFAPGSERQPSRHAAERRYAELMRAAGAPCSVTSGCCLRQAAVASSMETADAAGRWCTRYGKI